LIHHAFAAATQQAISYEKFHVTVEHGLEGLRSRPLGVLRRQRLDPIEDEEELEIARLLGPQGAVVVEGGDALRGR
jgi:hypothetical protein